MPHIKPIADEKTQKIIEQMAAEFILIDTSDEQALTRIIETFEELEKWAEEINLKDLIEVFRKAAEITETLKNKTPPETEPLLDLLSQTISAIQTYTSGRRTFDQSEFPEELGITAIPLHQQTQDHLESEATPSISPPPAQEENIKSSVEKDSTKPAPPPEAEPAKQGKPGLRHPGKLPDYLDEELFAEFLGIQGSVLEEIEALILEIESNENEESFGKLKRLFHTLKGEAGFLKLEEVERLCHTTEDIFESSKPAEYVDLFLSVKDWLEKAFSGYSGISEMPPPSDELLEMLNQTESTAVHVEPTIPKIDPELFENFLSRVRESLDKSTAHLLTLETDARNKIARDEIYNHFTTIKILADFLCVNDIKALACEMVSIFNCVKTDELPLSENLMDLVFETVDSMKELMARQEKTCLEGTPLDNSFPLTDLIDRLQSAASGNIEEVKKVHKAETHKKVGEILVASGKVTPEVVEQVLHKQKTDKPDKKLGEVLVTDGKIPAKDVAQALRTQKPVVTGGQAPQIREFVNIDAQRLDRIVNTIGELVIAESMVSQAEEIKAINSAKLNRYIGLLDKITRELQELGLSLRMVPIRPTFQKMERVVRDLSKKSEKKVKLVMTGEDTELDKTVVDKIGDPLLHMVRNAIDHGIENDLQTRLAAGKPETALVQMRAFHRGGYVNIEIEDDGKGIDGDAVQKKAVERNLIDIETSLSHKEQCQLIFHPGLSTANTITDVSGRGVGMDVVKSSIEALHGKVDVKSKKSKGSLFSIRIPLTLAIIDGMIVRVKDERYIIPTLSILTSRRIDRNKITNVLKQGEMIESQGGLIPLLRLGNLLGLESSTNSSDNAIIVVVEEENLQAGLLIDELLGKQQIVIKSLGSSMKNIAGISGGAIMADGRVALILDVGGVVKLAHKDQPQEALST